MMLRGLASVLPNVCKIGSPGDYVYANYDGAGRYLGGSACIDLYCGSLLGAGDSQCAIPTPGQVRQQQLDELYTTSAPQSAIDAAMSAGDKAVVLDQKARPGNYAAQCAAALHPELAATLGPEVVSVLFPTDADCNSSTPWALFGIIGLTAVALYGAVK